MNLEETKIRAHRLWLLVLVCGVRRGRSGPKTGPRSRLRGGGYPSTWANRPFISTTAVDFWGEHCPASRQISPVLRDLAAERASQLKVVKVHAIENAATSARYGVMAMPTVLVFAAGEVRGQLVGAQSKAAFVKLVESAS